MQLSVIIVNYNVKYFLEQCLHSVEGACINIDAEIIVVDNASFDGSAEYLQPKFPQIRFIKNEVNNGFAEANNKALLAAQGEFILFLNPDTIIAENSIVDCLRFFAAHAEAGAVGVHMMDGSGNFLPESKRAFPSLAASFWKLGGLAGLFPRSAIFNRYALGHLSEDATAEVDVLAGAFFMTRKKILLQLCGFDEDYFMYGEDIDLSYRIKKSGYKNYYLGQTRIIHFKGESAQKEKPSYTKNFYKAMRIFVHKHYSKRSSFFLNPAISLAGFIASVKNNFSLKKNEKANLNFILVGNDSDMRSAELILSNINQPFHKINSFDDLDSTSNFKRQTSNLIFCTGKLSYAEAIGFTQKNKNKFFYYWHASGSQCIVGSSSRSEAGKIYNGV